MMPYAFKVHLDTEANTGTYPYHGTLQSGIADIRCCGLSSGLVSIS
jgi:hypothetical protein